MAGYREHISISGLLGAGYGAASIVVFGFTPAQGALAGILTWVSGMLPDLDSETGKPVREIFSLLAAAVPLAMMPRLQRWTDTPEGMMLAAIGVYVGIRYGGSHLLKKLSVHRGMFHSIPALFIAAELAFLAYGTSELLVRLLMAGGVALGFLSHLLLDEMYAVEWTGIRIRLNKFAGSAMKLAGPRFFPNVFAYALLAVLTYASLVDIGVVDEPGRINVPTPAQKTDAPPVDRQAGGNGPARQ